MVRCGACNQEGHNRRTCHLKVAPDACKPCDVECAICIDSIGKTNCCVLECGHVFHMNCMVKALAKKNGCPMCRACVVKSNNAEVVLTELEQELKQPYNLNQAASLMTRALTIVYDIAKITEEARRINTLAMMEIMRSRFY